jgi:ABC-type Mn2+/Zn2+ transport system ATPase subunit
MIVSRPEQSSSAVRTQDLVLAHGDHVALTAMDVTLPAGAVIACIGPNGSGKSSFLDAVTGLLSPRSGTIEVLDGRPTRGRVAYVFQSTETPGHLPLTVQEVVRMGRYGRGGLLRPLWSDGHAACRAAMQRVGVTDLADRQLLELSGGQRQRVLVAQGLASQAELLVLDEPMTGLDATSHQRVLEVISEERDSGRTVLFSTHDLAEASRADVVVLLAGRLIAAGSPSEVLTQENLLAAYSGRVIDFGGVTILDDPHHHGTRAERHDGHQH